MNIIFGKKNADLLREQYLLLELETFDVAGSPLECYCLIDTGSIPINELNTLRHYTDLHGIFVNNLKNKNYKLCNDLLPHLQGKFGGSLDSFYYVIAERIKTANS